MRPLTLLLIASLALYAETELISWVRGLGGQVQSEPGGKVTSIALPYAWVTDSDLDALAGLRELQKLDLSLSLITDAGMERLKPLENVAELNLFAAEHITDTAMAYIRDWRKLERLNLRGTDVTDTALEYIAQIPSLRSLDVSYTQVTNNGLEFLGSLTKLEELAAGGNKITGAGLRILRLLPALRSLSLSGAQKRNSGTWSVVLTDLDLDAIATLQRLQSLDLAGMKITDAGVSRLGRLNRLTTLDLSRTDISAGGLQKLPLQQLERLSLHRVKRVDDGIADLLEQANKLSFLDLSETSFGDAGLARLSGLTSLRHLLVRDSRVTAAGVASFRTAHPSCHVSFE